MKQQCHLESIYLSWAVYVVGLGAFVWYSQWDWAVGWLVGQPIAIWLYVRNFPRFSKAIGYGPITDEPAAAAGPATVTVTLYTALGCPFCPLIEERLESLRKTAGFALEKIDITMRPDLLASKGIRTVPAVEVHGRFLFGLISTKELAAAVAEPG